MYNYYENMFFGGNMARLFDEHVKRKCVSLNGAWKMQKDENNVGREQGFQNGLSSNITTHVPSVWNSKLDMLSYEGVVWYQKDFYSEGGTVRLYFGAVMTECEVYLDGRLLGNHYGGFSSFYFLVENLNSGKHTLVLRVDNSFDEISIPQPLVDWYHYGGITREVRLEYLSGISILSNLFDYKINSLSADVEFRLELYNATDERKEEEISVSLDENVILKAPVTLEAREVKNIKLIGGRVENLRLWSPDSPALYTLKTESDGDDLYDRVGFRTVEIKNRAVYINGKPFRFRGINRHEEYPDFGMAAPELLMRRDLDIIINMGANSVRGSHYPNNPVFVDMLDEEGITFWSEIPIWGNGFTKEQLVDERIIERGLTMHREMVKEFYNHPSVIIWGMHNEIRSDTEEGRVISKVYYDYLKENGGNRIVTYATNKCMLDVCYDFCDMVCLNIYVGWYDDPRLPTWSACVEIMEDYIQKMGAGDKPVVMSEFGAAAIFGHHTFDNLKWTEEYQASLISECLNIFFSRKEYAGAFIWQFSDIRTAREMGNDRARSFNNKGLVNEYRRPKLAYLKVKEIYERIRNEEKTNG